MGPSQLKDAALVCVGTRTAAYSVFRPEPDGQRRLRTSQNHALRLCDEIGDSPAELGLRVRQIQYHGHMIGLGHR